MIKLLAHHSIQSWFTRKIRIFIHIFEWYVSQKLLKNYIHCNGNIYSLPWQHTFTVMATHIHYHGNIFNLKLQKSECSSMKRFCPWWIFLFALIRTYHLTNQSRNWHKIFLSIFCTYTSEQYNTHWLLQEHWHRKSCGISFSWMHAISSQNDHDWRSKEEGKGSHIMLYEWKKNGNF